MRTIYKYPFVVSDEVVIGMPRGATVLKVGIQSGQGVGFATLWAMVNPEQPTEPHYFAVVGTGNPVPDYHYHIDTWFDGPFVWHLLRKAIK